MADLRRIIMEDDPMLHLGSVEVKRFGSTLHKLLDDMKETMYHADGVGLAAPQVGINKQIIVVDDRENGFYEMVNPHIVQESGVELGVEFCLSVPGRGGKVPRATEITVEYQDRYGAPHTLEASGFFARVFQHEIDHLNGILFTDVMIEEVREQTEPAAEPRRKRIVGRKK